MINLIGFKMGLRYKGKTGGKDAWFNYSISSKGIHTSTSLKFGEDVTVNVSKSGTRTTYNMGDGLSYVTNIPNKKVAQTKSARRPTVYEPYSKEKEAELDKHIAYNIVPVVSSIVIAITFLFNI